MKIVDMIKLNAWTGLRIDLYIAHLKTFIKYGCLGHVPTHSVGEIETSTLSKEMCTVILTNSQAVLPYL